MRNNLLASAAAASALLYSAGAFAQSATVNTLQGSANSLAGAVNATNYLPDPGTVIVRLGGHYNFYAAAVTESGDKAPGFKQQVQQFGDYLHLSPSVDGVAANGMRYGVYTDIWDEHPGLAGVANGAGGGSISSITNNERYNSTLYLRHAYSYIGAPAVGTLRFGTDGVATLFQTGTFENFNDGGWNGDAYEMVGGNSEPTWPFAAVGNLYGPAKVTYLSPQIYGFEAGISYEPTTSFNNIFDQCNTASSGCARASASNVAGDLARRRNLVNPEIRFRGTVGPVGIAAEIGFIGSGNVQADAGGLTPAAAAAFALAPRYRGLDIGIGGIAITFSGLTVGGHVQAGSYNGQYGLAPVGSDTTIAGLVGASYTVGPVIVGASAFQYDSPGNSHAGVTPALLNVGQLRERGVAAGGTYTLVPGLSLFLDYLWGSRKENGYDLLNGATTYKTATPTQNNETRAQLLGLGTQLRW